MGSVLLQELRKKNEAVSLNQLLKKRSDIRFPIKKRQRKVYDTFIHCAAELKKISEMKATNEKGTLHCMKFALKNKIKNFVYVSSINVCNLKKNILTKKEIKYLKTKQNAEKILLKNKKKFKNLLIFRIPSPIGPRTPKSKIFLKFIFHAKKNKPIFLLGDPERVQNYLDLQDFAKVIEKSVENAAPGVYFVGNKNWISNQNLAKLIIKTLRSKSKIIVQNNKNEQNEKPIIHAPTLFSKTSLKSTILKIARVVS